MSAVAGYKRAMIHSVHKWGQMAAASGKLCTSRVIHILYKRTYTMYILMKQLKWRHAFLNMLLVGLCVYVYLALCIVHCSYQHFRFYFSWKSSTCKIHSMSKWKWQHHETTHQTERNRIIENNNQQNGKQKPRIVWDKGRIMKRTNQEMTRFILWHSYVTRSDEFKCMQFIDIASKTSPYTHALHTRKHTSWRRNSINNNAHKLIPLQNLICWYT